MTRPLLLDLRAVTVRFGGVNALDSVSVAVDQGQIHGIIGPNGAGKTTLFNVISGLTPASAGAIELDGAAIQALPPHRRARLGLARTFQNIRLFRDMTVLENVVAGMHPRLQATAASILLRLPPFRREEAEARSVAAGILAQVGLAGMEERPAGTLPYGDQRRLEIARALAGRPKLLLLDEPAAGMNPTETAELARLIRAIAGQGVTLLLIEHDMGFVMRLCDRVTVLNFGRKIAEGTPGEVGRDPDVIAAYLGAKLAKRLANQVPAAPSPSAAEG